MVKREEEKRCSNITIESSSPLVCLLVQLSVLSLPTGLSNQRVVVVSMRLQGFLPTEVYQTDSRFRRSSLAAVCDKQPPSIATNNHPQLRNRATGLSLRLHGVKSQTDGLLFLQSNFAWESKIVPASESEEKHFGLTFDPIPVSQ